MTESPVLCQGLQQLSSIHSVEVVMPAAGEVV